MADDFGNMVKKGRASIATATGVAKAAFPKLSLAATAAKGPVKKALRKRAIKQAGRSTK